MSISNLPPELAEILKLGTSIGHTEAFGIVAGRSAAAQAEGLLRIREGKLYRHCCANWKDFCPQYLRISGTQADRIIRLWQQYGPGFFELSQLVRVSPEFYRAIEPNIKDGALHFNGEAIELDPEISEKVAAIVAEIRRSLAPASTPKTEPTAAERVEDFTRRAEALIALFNETVKGPMTAADDNRLKSALDRLAAELYRPLPL